MEQEYPQAEETFPPLPTFFKTKLRSHPIIEISSDSDSTDLMPEKTFAHCLPPSRPHLTLSSRQVQQWQNNQEVNLRTAKLQEKSQKREAAFLPSNRHFNLSPKIPSQNYSSSSFSSQTPSSSEHPTSNSSSPELKHNLSLKISRRERNALNKARIALQLFNQHYSESDDIPETLKNDLWAPSKKAAKSGQQQSKSSSTAFNAKMTRRNFKSLHPFLDCDSKDFSQLDLEEELQRLEIGKYRYESPVLLSKISELASRVNLASLKKKKTAFVHKQPIVPLHSSKHATMVNLLRQKLARRAVIYLD